MSKHHRAGKHTSKAPAVRKAIKALLPQRCLDCPHVVTPEQRWQIAHRVPAMLGGETTIENCGPSHVFCPWCRKRCNQSSGGRMGAAVTNARRAPVSMDRADLWRW